MAYHESLLKNSDLNPAKVLFIKLYLYRSSDISWQIAYKWFTKLDQN